MRIGFIGAGNMGGIIVDTILKHHIENPKNLMVSRLHPERRPEWAAAGVTVLSDNLRVAEDCDCVFLAVKPQFVTTVLAPLQEALEEKLVVSIMAGWHFDRLQSALSERTRVLCIMPNTPLQVGEGMTLFSTKTSATPQELDYVKHIFSASGQVIELDETMFTAANAISGCGPAYAYLFMEALADGAVEHGVPRTTAYALTAQMLIGAGKMLQSSGKHPGMLKDAVCSPGGTTIAGIHALETGRFRASIMECVGAVVARDREIKSNHQ